MDSKLIHHEDGRRTYALVFHESEEVISSLLEFARENHLSASHFTGVGAFESLTLGYYDWERKDSKKIPIHEQVEVLFLRGNLAFDEGRPEVKAQVMLGGANGTAYGGQLIAAYARPALELIISESPQYLRRKTDPATGLALVHL